MFNMSIRTRLFLLVGLFSAVSIVISVAGMFGVSAIEQEVSQLLDTIIEARRCAHNLHRDFEHINALSNLLVTLGESEDPSPIFHEQDVVFTEMDSQIATITKLINPEEAAMVDQIRTFLEDYKRHNQKLRKLVTNGSTAKAVVIYMGEHSDQMRKLRETLVRATTELDRLPSPAKPAMVAPPLSAARLVRDVHLSLSTLHEWLGQMALETNDTKLAELSRQFALLNEKLSDQISQLAEADAGGQRLVLRLSPMIDSFRHTAAEIEHLTRTNENHQSIEIVHQGNTSLESTRNILRQLQARLLGQVDNKRAMILSSNAHTRSFFIATALVGIIAACTFAFYTTRQIYNGVQGIQNVVRHVADASIQIRAATQSMAQRTSEEASSLEETSSTMEEMAASVEQNRNGAARARELAERNGEAAQKNFEITSQAAQAMTALQQASNKISEISETVTEIAFQTNILALNASVEAARAGDHGRGFAVVAAEVRTLAQRTGFAAREISELIKDSMMRMERAVDLVDRSAHEIERMVESSRDYINLVANINAAAQEQASGIGQVTQSVMQLNTVVQSNSAQAEQMAAAAEHLMFQAEELQRALSLITGVTENTRVTTPPPPQHLSSYRPRTTPSSEPPTPAPIHSAPRDSDFSTF